MAKKKKVVKKKATPKKKVVSKKPAIKKKPKPGTGAKSKKKTASKPKKKSATSSKEKVLKPEQVDELLSTVPEHLEDEADQVDEEDNVRSGDEHEVEEYDDEGLNPDDEF